MFSALISSDIPLYSESFGDEARPVCLLACGAMSHRADWSNEFCLEVADAGFYVIRYDQRDSGLSGSSEGPYDLAALANDAVAVLDAYGVEKAHAAGHSMGGHVCLQLAIDHPDRLYSITAISAGPIGATLADRPLSQEEEATLNQTWTRFHARRDEDGVEGFLDVFRYLNGTFEFDGEMARTYTEALLHDSNHPPRAGNPHEILMRQFGETMEERRGLTEQIETPTLVIHGEVDPLALPRHGRALAEAVADARLEIIPGMGHFWFDRKLESKIAQLLIGHLKAATP